jgi:hypothetical protein
MTIPNHPPFEQIELRIHWADRIGEGFKSFANVQELAQFLKDNPAFAEYKLIN